MRLSENNQSPLAYDYELQQWTDGEAARQLTEQQILDELSVLNSYSGDDYCRFIGIQDKAGYIQHLQSQLA